jgi:hypothetical protein
MYTPTLGPPPNCIPLISSPMCSRSVRFPPRKTPSAHADHSQRDQEHIRHHVFKLTNHKRREDEIHSKHLSKQIRRHLSDKDGEADHDVASDSTEEDLMPLEVPSGRRGGLDKVGDGSRSESRVSDEDGSEKERAGEVTKD